MVARLLVSVGVVAASVGFTFLGIATSTYEVHEDARDIAYLLMGVGGVGAVIGLIMYRAEEGSRRA